MERYHATKNVSDEMSLMKELFDEKKSVPEKKSSFVPTLESESEIEREGGKFITLPANTLDRLDVKRPDKLSPDILN